MSLGAQLSDLAKLVKLPLRAGFASLADAGKERMGRIAKANDPLAGFDDDHEKPVVIFEIRRRAAKDVRPATDTHRPTPPRSYTERFDSGPHKLNRGNTVTALTPANHFDFRQAAVSRPQTAAPHIGQIPDPANDNDDWREAA